VQCPILEPDFERVQRPLELCSRARTDDRRGDRRVVQHPCQGDIGGRLASTSAELATVILDEAESWGADLIVLGSHGYNAWKRFLLGSVSQAVVSHAKCSVEVVRCSPTDSASAKT